MRRLGMVVMVLAIVAAGCGGADGDAAPTGDGATVDLSIVVDVETASVIDGFVDSLGPEEAFRGVLFAFDNGYDVGQVTAGMADGSLDGNGVIAGVEPAGAMVGLIDRSGPSAHSAVIIAAGPVIVAAGRAVTADEFKQGLAEGLSALFSVLEARSVERAAGEESLASDESRAMIGSIIGLITAGYSLDQVVEAVVFGEVAIPTPAPGRRLCLVLQDAGGEPVLPVDDPVDGLCTDFYEALRSATAATSTTSTTVVAAAPETGTVTGVVLDIAVGVGVVGAAVTVTPGGVAVTTDADGVFTFGDVEPGPYTLTVTAEGFSGAAAEVTVVAGQTSDTTIALEKNDDLPWVFEGTATAGLTADHPFGSGAPLVIRESVHVTITLNADGTAVFYREFPDTKESVKVSCDERSAYVSSGPGLPPATTVGTHAEGEFEVPMGDGVVTGTYSSSEIQLRWVYDIMTTWCDDPTSRRWKAEFSFGPEGMERVYDAP